MDAPRVEGRAGAATGWELHDRTHHRLPNTIAVLAPVMLLFIAAPLPSIVFGSR